MKCLDDNCPCLSHVDPTTDVPVCRFCRVPLQPWATDPSQGVCPVPRCPDRGLAFDVTQFAWMRRDVFNQSDLPPWCGWEPIEIPKEMLA